MMTSILNKDYLNNDKNILSKGTELERYIYVDEYNGSNVIRLTFSKSTEININTIKFLSSLNINKIYLGRFIPSCYNYDGEHDFDNINVECASCVLTESLDYLNNINIMSYKDVELQIPLEKLNNVSIATEHLNLRTYDFKVLYKNNIDITQCRNISLRMNAKNTIKENLDIINPFLNGLNNIIFKFMNMSFLIPIERFVDDNISYADIQKDDKYVLVRF